MTPNNTPSASGAPAAVATPEVETPTTSSTEVSSTVADTTAEPAEELAAAHDQDPETELTTNGVDDVLDDTVVGDAPADQVEAAAAEQPFSPPLTVEEAFDLREMLEGQKSEVEAPLYRSAAPVVPSSSTTPNTVSRTDQEQHGRHLPAVPIRSGPTPPVTHPVHRQRGRTVQPVRQTTTKLVSTQICALQEKPAKLPGDEMQHVVIISVKRPADGPHTARFNLRVGRGPDFLLARSSMTSVQLETALIEAGLPETWARVFGQGQKPLEDQVQDGPAASSDVVPDTPSMNTTVSETDVHVEHGDPGDEVNTIPAGPESES